MTYNLTLRADCCVGSFGPFHSVRGGLLAPDGVSVDPKGSISSPGTHTDGERSQTMSETLLHTDKHTPVITYKALKTKAHVCHFSEENYIICIVKDI